MPVKHAMETRMVFMFAGRVNMRASPRTGGAFFQSSVYTYPASTGGRMGNDGGGRESRMNGKKEGGREEMPPPSNLPVSRRVSQTREKNSRNTGMPHVRTPRLRDDHVVNRFDFFRAQSCVVLSRDCPKYTAPVYMVVYKGPYEQRVVFSHWIL